jgi:hypothetical protein
MVHMYVNKKTCPLTPEVLNQRLTARGDRHWLGAIVPHSPHGGEVDELADLVLESRR